MVDFPCFLLSLPPLPEGPGNGEVRYKSMLFLLIPQGNEAIPPLPGAIIGATARDFEEAP
jgi:hypothetical protein